MPQARHETDCAFLDSPVAPRRVWLDERPSVYFEVQRLEIYLVGGK